MTAVRKPAHRIISGQGPERNGRFWFTHTHGRALARFASRTSRRQTQIDKPTYDVGAHFILFAAVALWTSPAWNFVDRPMTAPSEPIWGERNERYGGPEHANSCQSLGPDR